jgi:hypothetical protein
MATLQLSPKGRQEFGNWLANRLVIVCGGASGLVIVPALTGKMALPALATLSISAVVIVLAVFAGLIKFYTAERAGEAIGAPEAIQ